jgi:predicted ATPase
MQRRDWKVAMANATTDKKPLSPQDQVGITQITVSGYKSISQEQSIEIRPLTLLAGANSSGKSSMIQPLLLLKQTLEANYDPGPLLLNGPHVKFTSVAQLLSHTGKSKRTQGFSVEMRSGLDSLLAIHFDRQENEGFEIQKMIFGTMKERKVIHMGMTHEEISSLLPSSFLEALSKATAIRIRWAISRRGCFLDIASIDEISGARVIFFGISLSEAYIQHVREVIHVPGLRGNPERTYPVAAVGPSFPGTFDNYPASVIAQWQADRNRKQMDQLNSDLRKLGLTWKIISRSLDDTQVELQVGRLPYTARAGSRDVVNIADVGFGVSQTLPVLVALHVAKPGQLVYIEQPELHLHPRAQVAMAQALADAAIRGVRVVAETHSSLLLLGVQTLVAQGTLPAETVKLHWFTRGHDGATAIKSASLDEAGTFGDWPEDFSDVDFEVQRRYLDAAEQRRWKR